MATYQNAGSPNVALAADAATDADVSPANAASGVSWGAIFAGATGAAALSFVLVLLGTGLGMSSVSPWANEGVDASTFGWAAAGWLTFISLAASGVGGYLAGRLRTKWAGLHTAEVYFRDTAHGFLAWSVATLITVVMVSTAVGSAVSAGAKAGASVAGGAASAVMAVGSAGASAAASSMPSAANNGDANTSMSYMLDSLFRTPAGSSAPLTAVSVQKNAEQAQEVYGIFANSLSTGKLTEEDASYVGQLIAERTGVSQAEAQKRVTDAFAKVQTGINEAAAQAKAAADKARKATAYASLWMVFSLLIGAFVASICATFGGRRRDAQSTY